MLADYTQNGKTGFCLENATMFQIQGMFENGKSDIVLKTDMGRDPKHPVFQFVPISYVNVQQIVKIWQSKIFVLKIKKNIYYNFNFKKVSN